MFDSNQIYRCRNINRYNVNVKIYNKINYLIKRK